MKQQHDSVPLTETGYSLSNNISAAVDEQPSTSYSPSTASAIIGSQLCAPITNQVELAMIAEDDEFLSVKDVEGNIVFHIQEENTFIHERRLLLDGAGNPLVTLQRKKKSIHKMWKVYKGDNRHSRDLLFSARQASSKFPNKLLDVFLASNSKRNVSDYMVKGSWLERSCTFYAGSTDSDTIIAQVIYKHLFNVNEFIWPRLSFSMMHKPSCTKKEVIGAYYLTLY